MKKFIFILLILAGILNLFVYLIFFNLNESILKLLLSESSIFISGFVIITINSKSSHDGFKIAGGLASAIFAVPQWILSYFISNDLKMNFVFFIWVLLLFLQFIILASVFLIKPRP